MLLVIKVIQNVNNLEYCYREENDDEDVQALRYNAKIDVFKDEKLWVHVK